MQRSFFTRFVMDINENEKEEQKIRDIVPSDKPQIVISNSNTETDSGDKKKKKKKRKKRPKIYLGYTVTSACVVIAFAVMITAMISTPTQVEEEVPAFKNEETEEEAKNFIYVREVADGGLSTAEIYASCAESVVSIVAEGVQGSGIGSGFVISEDGYIATAEHVIRGGERISVILYDGEEYSAQVIGGNELTDLALLKIDAKDLRSVKMGDSSELVAGERVVAIGTPASLDFAGSVCSGEISFPNRIVKVYGSDGVLQKKMTLIQTDAPVNPGNSGCPLFDSEGKVIGIVTMKLGQNFSGVGFAIPVNEALGILNRMMFDQEIDEALISAISVRAAKLGIIGNAFDSNGLRGVRVEKFISNEFDSSIKLKLGDIITHVANTEVTSAKKLSDAINRYAPNDKIDVTVYRDGQKLTFEVILGG